MNVTALGVLFLGGLIGLLLGSIWQKESKTGFKALTTVISLLFSGTLAAFISDVSDERWMYPIGLLIGFIWSKFGPVFNVLSKQKSRGNGVAKLVASSKIVVTAVASVGAIFVALMMSTDDGSTAETAEIATVAPVVMPCRLAWVFLGRFGNASQQYVTPPGFRYANQTAMRGPIPSVGDRIVITEKRNLLVAGFESAEPAKKCNRMLEPPRGYRPETASDYIAGSVVPGQEFMINELSFLPERTAEPTYIWASVRLP